MKKFIVTALVFIAISQASFSQVTKEELYVAINNYRQTTGIKKRLKVDNDLELYAQKSAERTSKLKKLVHVKRLAVGADSEILALIGIRHTPFMVVEGWKRSPKHKEIMDIKNYKYIGVGTSYHKGVYYYAVWFK